jgi:hypothetical protein
VSLITQIGPERQTSASTSVTLAGLFRAGENGGMGENRNLIWCVLSMLGGTCAVFPLSPLLIVEYPEARAYIWAAAAVIGGIMGGVAWKVYVSR